jgi:hypothetical protein
MYNFSNQIQYNNIFIKGLKKSSNSNFQFHQRKRSEDKKQSDKSNNGLLVSRKCNKGLSQHFENGE